MYIQKNNRFTLKAYFDKLFIEYSSMNSETYTQSILVIIPCFNEQGRIGSVVRSVKSALSEADVIVVDDASTDSSKAEAEQEGAKVLSHVCNMGYGSALETGYLYAKKNNYNIVLQLDGDGQHLAPEIEKILQPVSNGKTDIVIGSRYGKHSKLLNKIPFFRRLGHLLFSSVIMLLTGHRLSDPTSGFQALGPRAINLFSSGIFPCDYPDSDIILVAHLSGLKITEAPVNMRPRSGGKSMHKGFEPFYYSIKMLLSMFIVLLNFRKWSQWRKGIK